MPGKHTFTAARRRALAKARKKWKSMSHAARKKAMPSKKRRR